MTNVIKWGNPALRYLDFSRSFTAQSRDLADQGIRPTKDGIIEIHADEGVVVRFRHYKDTHNQSGFPFSSEYEVVIDEATPPGIDRKLALMLYHTR